MRYVLIAASLLACSTTLAEEIDYIEAWHACDEAAADEGFAEAALLDQDNLRGSVVNQIAGRWQGQDLIVITAPTSTGRVFCMTTTDYEVVQYRFDGQTIIERD